MSDIKLTQYSHGAGCGCKLSPQVLEKIIRSQANSSESLFPALLVGNRHKDDAAVYAIDDQKAVISTTDFFMPIVDDPFEFGYIASVNAISDVYAMGGKPIMAIAVLGWPINTLSAEIASLVVDGAQAACSKAGIPLAGGHSIDAPEPIFGLAVTGLVDRDKIKSNGGAQIGDRLFLTKPLGVGILTTAMKKNLLNEQDYTIAIQSMKTLNDVGTELGQMPFVHALTDVTGFGLLGHLREALEASKLSAELEFTKIAQLTDLEKYLELKCIPGGTMRNLDSYGERMNIPQDKQKMILADPQTSGGLLICVDPVQEKFMQNFLNSKNLCAEPIGTVIAQQQALITVI